MDKGTFNAIHTEHKYHPMKRLTNETGQYWVHLVRRWDFDLHISLGV